MLPASWEEYVAKAQRELKKAPDPIRRHQPRVTRMQSARMRRVSSQTGNSVRASYVPESVYNATPTKPEEWKGTRNVGGNCEPKTYQSGKETTTRIPRNKNGISR
jgi:hypothetical protein